MERNSLKKLLIYFKNYKLQSILGPLFKLLEATFELFVPLVIADIIDKGIGLSDRGLILQKCLILLALAIIGMVSSITAQYFAAKAAVGFTKQLKRALFSHIQGLSYTELDTLGTSTIITRMTSDINQVQTGVNLTLRLLLRSPFIVFGSMVMAFRVDPKTAMVFAVVIPVLSVVVFGIMLMSIPLYKKVQARLDRVMRLTRDNLTGVRVLRAFCKEDEEIREFDASNEALVAVQVFAGRISALMNPLTYVIINVGIVCLIWSGALHVNSGAISQGEVVALYNYMSQILVELIKLASLIITITKSLACANRIQSVFEIRSSLADGTGLLPEQKDDVIVEFRNVDFRYKGAEANALSGINISVRRGETVGIIGGTGSGKTSLVNLIGRFYDATAGEVCVDGNDVKDYTVKSLRAKIGIVPQKSVLFKGSIRDNIRWGKQDATDEEILEAIRLAQAADLVKDKGGLDFMIEQGGKNLSGGQKQRLTIARALVKQPEILILDDSASALDYATDAALRKSISDLRGKPTVFIVSQRTSSIQHADKIVVLDDGKMVGFGKHHELLENCLVYREIYDSQFKKEAVGNGSL